MLKRGMAGVAAALFFSITALAEPLEYKNIGPREKVGRIVRELAGDDVEVRRVATDDLKVFSEKAISKLGIDPEAERSLALVGDGMAELFWMGKATSRARAERSMDEIVESLALAARSQDKPKANAAQKVLLRYASVLLRNPDHSSSAELLADLKSLFKSWGVEEAVSPATEVTSFLTESTAAKPADPVLPEPPMEAAKTQSAPATLSEVGTGSTTAPTPDAAAPQVSVPAVAVASGAREVTITAPELSRLPRPEQTAPVAAAQKPRVVETASWKYDDPALRVTTIVAPSKSRAGAEREEAAVATPKPQAPTPPSDGTSILNILISQLSVEEERRLEAGLKLTGKTSEAVLANLNHGNDERSKTIIKRVRSLLDHKDVKVKRQAITTAGALKDSLAAQKLASMLNSGDEATSKRAHEALVEISGTDFGPSAESWSKWAASVR